MTEFTMDRLRENLEALKMKNTLEILDNYLERAVADKLNIVEVLDHIFSEEAKSKRRRAYEKQIQMSGFPIKKTLDDFDFSFQPSIDKRQIDELATMRFLENGENVVFLGPPGVGKTHLASDLGLVAAQRRFSTYYINLFRCMPSIFGGQKKRLRKRNRCGSQRRKRRKRRKIFRYRWSGVRKRKNACPLDTKLFLLPKPRFFPKIKGSVSVYVVPRGG